MWGSPGLLLCLSVWPVLCLPDSGPVCICLSAPLSEFGAVCESVSRCLITLGLSRPAMLSVYLSAPSLGSHPSLASEAECCLGKTVHVSTWPRSALSVDTVLAFMPSPAPPSPCTSCSDLEPPNENPMSILTHSWKGKNGPRFQQVFGKVYQKL